MFANKGQTIPLVLAVLALASTPSVVRAQGNAFNPYGNSGYEDYREFTTPMTSNNPALPGQARLNQEPIIGRQRGNSYQRYLDEEEAESGLGSSSRESSSRLPYYMASQQQNRLNNRVYKPNNTPENQKFEERQKQRELAYAKALEEKDPVKRAKLLRQLDQQALESSLAAPRSRSSSTTTTPGASRSTSGAAGASRASSSAPPPPLGDRRSSAPPPYPTTDTRRPSTSTNRAPAPPRTGTSAPKPDANSRPATDPSTVPIPPPR